MKHVQTHQHTDPTAAGYIPLAGEPAPVRWWYRLHLLDAAGGLVEDVTLPHRVANAEEAAAAAREFVAHAPRIRYRFASWRLVRVDQTETTLEEGVR